MAVQNLEISTKNLLGSVLRLPRKEFDHFFEDAKRLKNRETELIGKLKTFDLTPEKEKLYRKLLKKFRAENISPEEHKTLTQLTQELEGYGVERLRCLIEISKIRNQSLDEIMLELNIKPKNYG